MNIPEFYLIEPYNAYTAQKGGRKKHWHEIIEEQALLERIIADQIALQEANSRTLPPNSPPTSVATAVGASTVAGGAGGSPVYQFFHPELDAEKVSFTRSPSTGDAPLTVQFVNTTPTPEFDFYNWYFGDGTTSTETSPIHVYQSGSQTTSSFTASLQMSSSTTGLGVGSSSVAYISASIPTVTATFTYVTSSRFGPATATFTNTSTNTSQTPTTTYLWQFGSGSVTSSLVNPSTFAYNGTGSFTASLQATGSYGIASKYTQSFFITAPQITASFTVVTSSKTAPSIATFTNTTKHTGSGNLIYLWQFGSASLTSTLANPPPFTYTTSSNYTASLQVTESAYINIMSSYTQSWRIA